MNSRFLVISIWECYFKPSFHVFSSPVRYIISSGFRIGAIISQPSIASLKLLIHLFFTFIIDTMDALMLFHTTKTFDIASNTVPDCAWLSTEYFIHPFRVCNQLAAHSRAVNAPGCQVCTG